MFILIYDLKFKSICLLEMCWLRQIYRTQADSEAHLSKWAINISVHLRHT